MTPLALHLQPFYGYLELGLYDDANNELESLPDPLKNLPEVLLARLELLMMLKRWEDGAMLGQSLCGLWPKQSDFWFRTAFCLHEMRRTEEARQTLLNAPEPIQNIAVYSYNLACYESQLGDVRAAKKLLKECFDKDASFKQLALDDPDLQPVWDSIGNA